MDISGIDIEKLKGKMSNEDYDRLSEHRP